MALRRTQDAPTGNAVCDTLSLTSNTVNLTRDSPAKPSEARKHIVLRKPGLLLFWNRKQNNAFSPVKSSNRTKIGEA